MFSTRMKDSPYKKRYSTLEEKFKGQSKRSGDGILGNREFGVEFSPIHLVKFAEALIVKGMLLKNQIK